MNKYYFDEERMKNYEIPENSEASVDKNFANLKILIEKGYRIESYYDHMYTEFDAGIKFHYPEELESGEYSLFIDIIHNVLRHNDMYNKFCELGTAYVTDTSAEDVFNTDNAVVMPGWAFDFVVEKENATFVVDNSGMAITYQISVMGVFLDILANTLPNVDSVINVIEGIRVIK